MFPSQIPGVYSDVEEILINPVATILRAILSSDYLNFSDSAEKIFSECINQSRQRLGEQRTAELVSETVLLKLQKKRLQEDHCSNSTAHLAKDLLLSLYDSTAPNSPDDTGAYDSLEAFCCQNYPLFIIAATLVSKGVFEFVPLSSSHEEQQKVQAIQRAVADRVWRLILSDPRRLLPDAELASTTMRSFFSSISAEDRRILRQCIQRLVEEEGSQSATTRLARLLGEH